jgi:hypothetical protein
VNKKIGKGEKLKQKVEAENNLLQRCKDDELALCSQDFYRAS